MLSYEQRLLTHYGYLETKGCAHATLCPALSLPDLFSAGRDDRSGRRAALSAASISTLLAAVPPVLLAGRDHPRSPRGHAGLRDPADAAVRQQRVIDYMRSQLHPPPGVTAQLAGLPVLGGAGQRALSSSARRLLTLLAGLVAVGLVLLAVFRGRRRALVPLIPIALATGWSALILFADRDPAEPDVGHARARW